jgi:hypothetical protein
VDALVRTHRRLLAATTHRLQVTTHPERATLRIQRAGGGGRAVAHLEDLPKSKS